VNDLFCDFPLRLSLVRGGTRGGRRRAVISASYHGRWRALLWDLHQRAVGGGGWWAADDGHEYECTNT
jgi:hypothetical protein